MERAGLPSAGGRERALQLWASGVGIGGEVGRLGTALEDIRSVLSEAMGKEIQNEALERSLKEALHMASRAEDLQSALDYFRIQHELEREERGGGDDSGEPVRGIGQMNGVLLSTPEAEIVPYDASLVIDASDTNVVPHLEQLDVDSISWEINEHVEGCFKMTNYIRRALVLENLDYRIAQKYWSTRADPRETSPFPTEPKVYGRIEERDIIISKLLSDESDGHNLSVLAIIGNGGVGKTTLAKVVYNDPAVLEHFDILLWIYVSVYFDPVKIMRELLEHLCKDRHENIRELKELQNFLANELKFKRVLLVMDDMWEDGKKEIWDEVLIPLLTNHTKGNKILVTTRKLSVAKMTRAMHVTKLGGLQPAEFLCLFKECAFGDENFGGHRKLQRIGQQIVVKLKGYPLAAKTVGKLLRRKLDEEHWIRVLESSEWMHQQDDNDIMPALRISYKYLPVHLQQCFSFCAVFPKNHRYDGKKLVNIWIALGFVSTTDQIAQAEDTGSKYLADLIDSGFFLNESPRSYIIMHDLLHDLAQIVSSDECFTIEELEPLVTSQLVRHVSIITESAYYGQLDGIVLPNQFFLHEFSRTFRTLQEKNLRTLMLFGAHDLNFADTFQYEFKEVKAVRVLNIEMVHPKLNSLISNISEFINLRYLELRSYYYGPKLQLPEAICKLYHLEVLDLKHNWGADTILPRGLKKLVNLRHFFAEEELHKQIASVGRLIFLQELKAFDVREDDEFSIAQLGLLNELRGSIRICNLQKLKSTEEAVKARLRDKLYLKGLHLSWFPNRSVTIDTLEGLEPPKGIEMLRIDGYKFPAPSWIYSSFCLTSLQSLHLENCKKWSTLPPSQHLPHLKELHLIWMHHMDKLEVGHLKVLELRNIRKLRRCMELDREQFCANLEVLDIQECHHLRDFPFHASSESQFPRLRKLRMHECCQYISLPPLPLQDTLTDIDIKGAFPNYEVFRLRAADRSRLRLEIKGFDHVKKLDETVLKFSKLKDLQEFEIKYYPDLAYLAWEGLQEMTSLKSLKLLDCPNLFSSNTKLFVPPSVEELEFARCNITGKQLSYLMLYLPVLKTLKLTHCKRITLLVVGMLVDEQNSMAEGTWNIPPCCLMTLERLHISFSRAPDSSMLLLSKEGLGGFESLKEITVTNGDKFLSSMISEVSPELLNHSLLPRSLLKLHITDLEDNLLEVRICTNANLASVQLQSCTMLEKLCVKECPKLTSWQGFWSFLGLKYLTVSECPGFVSSWLAAAEEIDKEGHMFSIPIKRLDIDDRSILTMPICRQLISLETLNITGDHCTDEADVLMDSQGAALSILISLKDLTFSRFKDAWSLPGTLHCLTSLHSLTIQNCPGISSLPEEGLPPSLVQMDLYRNYSSELSESCLRMSKEQQFRLYINGQEA
ncbi:unnamed protein product [Urochloa humidicola]